MSASSRTARCSSYYQSDDFALQKLQYEPVARFGIGMLSCFMVARAILIESKKDKCVNTAWNITNKESLEPVMAKWLEGSDTMEYVNCNREESDNVGRMAENILLSVPEIRTVARKTGRAADSVSQDGPGRKGRLEISGRA